MMLQLTCMALVGFSVYEAGCQQLVFKRASRFAGTGFWSTQFGKEVLNAQPFVRLMLHELLKPSGLVGRNGYMGHITGLRKVQDNYYPNRMNFYSVSYRQYYYNSTEGKPFSHRKITSANCALDFYVEENLIPKGAKDGPKCDEPQPYKRGKEFMSVFQRVTEFMNFSVYELNRWNAKSNFPGRECYFALWKRGSLGIREKKRMKFWEQSYANSDTIRSWLHKLLYPMGEYGEGAFIDEVTNYNRHKDDNKNGKHYSARYVLVKLNDAEGPKKLDITKVTQSNCNIGFYVSREDIAEVEKGPTCDKATPIINDKGVDFSKEL